MTDRPLSVPGNIKLPDYYLNYTAISPPANTQLKNLNLLNFKSSIEHNTGLKVIRSTVLLI